MSNDAAVPSWALRVEKVAPPAVIAVGTVYVLAAGEHQIGRDLACDVILADTRVSRRHARIAVGEDGLRITCASGRAVFVNEEKVEEAALAAWDWLQLGGVLLRVHPPAGATEPSVDAMRVGGGAGPLTLDPTQHRAWFLGQELKLQPAAFTALGTLAARPGQWVPTEQLVNAIWPDGIGANPAYVTKYVSYVRAELARATEDVDGGAQVRELVRAHADAHTDLDALDDLDLRELMRELVKARRKVGFRLVLAPGSVSGA